MAAEPNSHCTSAHGFQRTAEGLVYEADCKTTTGPMTMTGAGMSGGMQMRVEGTYEGACRGDK